MSSTMSGRSPKTVIPIQQKLRYHNTEQVTRNFKPFKLFKLSFNADMPSTMSGYSPKAVNPIQQRLRYPNTEHRTRNAEHFPKTSNSSNPSNPSNPSNNK